MHVRAMEGKWVNWLIHALHICFSTWLLETGGLAMVVIVSLY